MEKEKIDSSNFDIFLIALASSNVGYRRKIIVLKRYLKALGVTQENE